MNDVERYLILVEGRAAANYSAWSPDVPGCAATGSTIDDCVEQMRGALQGHLDAMREHGETAPKASGPGVYVERTLAA